MATTMCMNCDAYNISRPCPKCGSNDFDWDEANDHHGDDYECDSSEE